MNYNARIEWSATGQMADDQNISIEKEGLRLGREFLLYADLAYLRPVNHRVILTKMDQSAVIISMLGFSFDGFWEELISCFGQCTMDCLFMEEEKLMDCEGEYALPPSSVADAEAGRGRIMLYEDAVCVLPESSHAVRIPLCYTSEILLNGYMLQLRMRTGEIYTVGKMGYDTHPFAERCEKQAAKTKKARAGMLAGITPQPLFPEKGLFRTKQTDEYWLSAYGDGKCAVELFTGDAAATYLYRFDNRQLFTFRLEEAMEAVGSHREIIFLPDEQIAEKPLYRMTVHRSEAVRFLRSCSAGRIIHNAGHAEKLADFLGN